MSGFKKAENILRHRNSAALVLCRRIMRCFRISPSRANVGYGLNDLPSSNAPPAWPKPCAGWVWLIWNTAAGELSGASSSAWRWRGPWCDNRGCCCSTNRWPRSTRQRGCGCAASCDSAPTAWHSTVLVTHDRFEALALGDDVVVLHDGRNVQHGAALSFQPAVNLAVAVITAVETVLPGHILETRDAWRRWPWATPVDCAGGKFADGRARGLCLHPARM